MREASQTPPSAPAGTHAYESAPVKVAEAEDEEAASGAVANAGDQMIHLSLQRRDALKLHVEAVFQFVQQVLVSIKPFHHWLNDRLQDRLECRNGNDFGDSTQLLLSHSGE